MIHAQLLLPAFIVLSSTIASFSLLILILNTNSDLRPHGHNSSFCDPTDMVVLNVSSIVACNLTNMLNADGNDDVDISVDIGVDVDDGY